MKNIIAIIPARGGSKGIFKKNIKLLAGKPLIAYSIEQAKRSKSVNKVIVSTDDDEISEIARRYGADVLIRPKELAHDDTPMIPVIKQVVNEIEKKEKVDYVILLQPTSPLRLPEHIDKAVEMLNNGFDSVTSVTNFNFKLGSIVKINEEKTINALNEKFVGCRQKNELYWVDGSIFGYKRDVIDRLEERPWCENNAALFIEEKYACDIDTEEQWKDIEKKIMRDNLEIKEDNNVLMIAEAGGNHNGSLELAKKMVDAAKDAECDIVKFQTYTAAGVMIKKTPKADYHKEEGNQESYFDLQKSMELSKEEFKELKLYCEEKRIKFLSSPHAGEESVDWLEEIGIDIYKIGSGELNNLPFLKYVAKTGKPIILSTGMGTIEEIKEAVEAIKEEGNNKIKLMQCTSEYPCPIENINLRAIKTISNGFGLPVGFSDHTPGLGVVGAAIGMGAMIIEKHFTLDKNMKGPDHKASLEPDELKKYVEIIRNVEKALGDGVKKPTATELEVAKVARKSIVSIKEIKKGKVITKEDLGIKRPGIGIAPKEIGKIIGMKAKNDIEDDIMINWDDLE